MNPKHFVEEDLLWKMYINMEDYKNIMVSWKVTRTEMVSYILEQNGITWKVTGIE
jgi:hypothetical protein